ncbi:MAG: SGNH/GDSL hydrolase family protein [Chthoniobacteraceae bacterium]
MKPTLLLALSLLPFTALAQTPAAPEAPAYEPRPIVDNIELKDGDTLVFLGDSITHQCLYTQYIEDYYYTRFPKMRLHFHNSGVGGDRATDALRRFDDDVAAYKPKYVTILLGMNDGSYTNYQQSVFDTYQTGMNAVLDRIKEIGAVAVPMTPTMHDSRARRIHQAAKVSDVRETYYNGVLALYGAWLQEQAEVRGLGFVDMYSPLNTLTLQQRTKDPKWTMIRDAVHPGPAGQVIMACAILADMVPRSTVSQTTIAERAGKPTITVGNGSATGFSASPTKVAFTLTANALPWVLPEDAAEGYKLAAAGHRYSNEKLTVQTLKAGKYELKIDDQPVGTWTAEQFARGVELETNPKTPQYQQAMQVALLNKKRNDEAYHPLRDQYAQLKGQRRAVLQATEANAPDLDAKKAAFEQWYAGQKAKVAEFLAKAKAIEDEIYQVNQPKPHRYELAPVAEPVKKRQPGK